MVRTWKWVVRAGALWVVLFLAGCAGVAGSADRAPKNIIVLFADGAAPTQWDFGRRTSQALRGRGFTVTDTVFDRGTLGLLVTSPANAYITDSAAAASAMSIGAKVNNGAISITPDGRSDRPTLMESAKAAGKRIGLVSTATIYDASPAAFSVHARVRTDSQSIVDQYFALSPDVLMGGGRDYFLPEGRPGGKRKDGRDVVEAFRARGYAVVTDQASLKAAQGARLLGLFADEDMDFEIDRDASREPSTAEMARAALKVLEGSPNGFVLFVENENTDTAGHKNDAAALMRALWAFDEAVDAALEFQRRHPDTLIIVTGDHETGGLSITYAQRDLSSMASSNRFAAGDNELKMIAGITSSFDAMIERLGKAPTGEALDRELARHFPGFRLDADLRELLLAGKPLDRNFTYGRASILGRMVARQTGIYWGTAGHTTEPVAVGALGPGAERFRGYYDNTQFAERLRALVQGR
jgi:alkaline phosphatase